MPCELCQRVALLEDRADTHAALFAVVAVMLMVLMVALVRTGALPKLSALVAAVHA